MDTDLENAPYKSSGLSSQERADDLLSRMTLEEKIAQIRAVTYNSRPVSDKSFDTAKALDSIPHGIGFWGWPQTIQREQKKFEPRPFDEMTEKQEAESEAAITSEITNTIQKFCMEETRLGIPVLFHTEALHGMGIRGATSFPQSIALASTWDTEGVQKCYEAIAGEGKAAGIRQVLAPVLDVLRDPRWGRVEETFGEDPFLASRMAAAAVEGLQGKEITSESVCATLKHFIAFSKPEGGRNMGPASLGERELREVFLPVFESVIRNIKAGSVMPGYNEIDGIPCHANRWLLKTLLFEELGFEGVVVSNYGACRMLNSSHGIAESEERAAAVSFKAGVDVEFPDTDTFRHVKKAVESGEIETALLDDAVSRILKLKFRLGLFDTPYSDTEHAVSVTACTEHRKLSLETARKSITLLQNFEHILPLDPDRFRKIAVIGPNASVGHIGGYGGWPDYVIDPLTGIRNLLGDTTRILYAEGCSIYDLDEQRKPVPASRAINKMKINKAKITASAADAIILCLGENEILCGQGLDSHSLELEGHQLELLDELSLLGKPIVAVIISGRPLVLTELSDRVSGILQCWYLGQEGGTAIADVLFGKYNPGGKLPVSFPRHAGTVPCYYNHKPDSDANYVFSEASPLFPFGAGLSYTRFIFSGLTVEPSTIPLNGKAEVSITVSNQGKLTGDEVVQLYIRDEYSSVTRPVKELKGFRRITLAPDEEETVTFTLGPDELSMWDISMERRVEPGTFRIMVGPDSENFQEGMLTVE